MVDVAISSYSNLNKKEHKKLIKYQGLKEELGREWAVKELVVPVMIGALSAVTLKLGEWLQQTPE